MKEQTREERILEIKLLLTHPAGVGLKWQRLLVDELISYTGSN